MKATPSHRHPYRRRVANTTILILTLLLFSTAPLTRAVDNAITSNDAENAKAEEEEEVAATAAYREPVCKSNAAGVMNCRDPEEDEHNASSESIITADGEVAMNGNDDGENIDDFQCKDLQEECTTWSTQQVASPGTTPNDLDSACTVNSAYMTHNCPLSCNKCDIFQLGYRLSKMLEGGLSIYPFCQDHDFNCVKYAEAGECDKNPEYMNIFCEASCEDCSEESNQFGVGQKLPKDPKKRKPTMEKLAYSIEYMMGTVKRDRKYEDARENCLNMVPDCTLWAAHGECDSNSDYMRVMCAPACMACIEDTSDTWGSEGGR
mmetsp:Transcript_27601/g.57642  ORF Transcript_27601/g.57642 Transcript_27601/m.57642 type:complete len:320 (-) Transcript_27601:378-1337(-)